KLTLSSAAPGRHLRQAVERRPERSVAMSLDLLVSGGTVVSSQGRRRANVGVADGFVRFVGSDTPAAARTVDASGLLVLPGAVDTHVHLMDPGSTDREDFPTGSAAAAAAGVT